MRGLPKAIRAAVAEMAARLGRPEMLQRADSRQCGDCRLCCTLVGVEEIEKPPGVQCSHLCAAGCAIYAKRPGSCREWFCTWRIGIGGREQRPDRMGAVGNMLEDLSEAAGTPLVDLLCVDGLTEAAKAHGAEIARHGLVVRVHLRPGTSRPDALIVGEEHERARELLESGFDSYVLEDGR